MIKWFKKLMKIVAEYDSDKQMIYHWLEKDKNSINTLQQNLRYTNELMRERTELHVDVPHFRNCHCTVVVAGRYRDNDYVQIYSLRADDFSGIVDYLKELKHHARVATVDAPIMFKEYIRKEV